LGGTMTVAGLILLLWINKYFTPPVVALTLGIGNGAMLLTGWAAIRRSRYQMAGRALTLLACLIMPLNLWYYHAQGLLTIEGHLWVAGVCISALYAASALVLGDELFVYVFAAGVAMTGLLMLADLPPSPEKFWEIASPASLLVVLGLLGIHTERAFPVQQGPFSRQRFGLAFFRSGHALLGSGLLLLLGAQIVADWLYEPVFQHYYALWHAERTPIVTEQWGRLLALCLVVAATYAYIYSDLVVRRIGVYIHLAAATLLWTEVLLLQLLHVQLGIDLWIMVLAGTSLLLNALYAGKQGEPLTRSFPIVGLGLSAMAVALGLFVYVRALSPDFKSVWQNEPPQLSYLTAMALSAVSCWLGAQIAHRKSARVSMLYFFGTGAAGMLAAVAGLALVGLTQWQQHAPLMMLLPIAVLSVARLSRGRPAELALVWLAHAAAIVMLVSGAAVSMEGFSRIVHEQTLNLVLALFFAEAALFYALAAGWHKQPAAVSLSAAMACATIWQLLTYCGVQAEAYAACFALIGLGLLVAYRLSVADGVLSQPAYRGASMLLSLSFVSSVFIGASRLAMHHVEWKFVGLSAILVLMSVLAAVLIREGEWRRWYVVLTVLQAIVTILAIQQLSTLTIYQKVEIFSVAVGLCLLVVGHLGWYREQDRPNDVVSVSLFLGSLLAGIPLAVATLYDRWQDHFLILNELGWLTVAIVLLATGFIFQLKSTTLTGATLTVLYFLTLLVYVPWSRLNAVAIMITAGGGLVFAIGLLLSLYRDRLLALPEKVHKREGLFRILSWR
jgi:hypothetical protein